MGETATDYEWTFSQTGKKASGGILRCTNVDSTDPTDISAPGVGANGNLVAPTVDPTSTNGYLLNFYGLKKTPR